MTLKGNKLGWGMPAYKPITWEVKVLCQEAYLNPKRPNTLERS